MVFLTVNNMHTGTHPHSRSSLSLTHIIHTHPPHAQIYRVCACAWVSDCVCVCVKDTDRFLFRGGFAYLFFCQSSPHPSDFLSHPSFFYPSRGCSTPNNVAGGTSFKIVNDLFHPLFFLFFLELPGLPAFLRLLYSRQVFCDCILAIFL